MSSPQDGLQATLADGTVVNLSQLVTAAREIRRNSLKDAKRDAPYAISWEHLNYVIFGMQIAVTNLFGDDAAQRFREQVYGPVNPPCE